MLTCRLSRRLALHVVLAGLATVALAVLPLTPARAGHLNFRNNSVGGISINPLGVVGQPSSKARQMLLTELRRQVKKAPAGLDKPVKLRKISLRGLEAACDHALKKNFGKFPDEVKYLGGLTRIEYVFVYPELNDVVIAGPAEPWTIDSQGVVVGASSGAPVLHLEDLIVALRSIKQARQSGITCSIDPTAEGRQRLQAYLNTLKQFNPRVVQGVEKAMGPQKVTITGVPADSHFARVLVAADYRMKRYAMMLEQAPIKTLPSFLHLMKQHNVQLNDMMPRWWLACNYQPLATGADGLAWQIRGPGVKAMTEQELIAKDGAAKGTGKVNPVAQKWADAMTKHYQDLAAKDKVFAQLRNIMDMCVVAALIEKENLLGKASLKLPLMTDSGGDLMHTTWNKPKTVATQCSYIKMGRRYVITASGGVEIEAWDVVARAPEKDKALTKTHNESMPLAGAAFWWN